MGRPQMERWILVAVGLLVLAVVAANPRRILYDTDLDTDDVFALLYLLKQNRSEFDLKAITISANGWTDAGHAVNQAYDILYMMDRDDIPVGVGGDGGISHEGNIFSNVGGYLPLIEQGMSTAGYCRYRQAIPIGGGRLIVDTNYGIRRGFLPQGYRKYTPLSQPTAQQVMIDTISAGPTTVLVTGSQTNLALFLMKYPQLKKNIQHIYVMGGGVRSKNPTGCCPKNAGASCTPEQCGDVGNLFSAYRSNPYAEFNVFMDPFAAYQVLHSGIPVTLVPLDATNTIPVDSHFFAAFEQNQNTFEAQYSFQSLIMTRDTWFDDKFYTSFFMWDSFLAGVAVSDMRNGYRESAENEFADMEYLNITVVTSNIPYGINSDGSNPFFDGHFIPKFRLKRGGVHSGHVQMGPADPFCSLQTKGKGRCQDGYTKEVNGSESVRVLVATKAKPNREAKSPLNRQFYTSFLEVLNRPQQSGRFNFYSQFPCYKEAFYKPDFGNRKMGKPLVFDMDMSAGDFLALIVLLKVPVEEIDLKAILVSGNGWADPATIDVVYDVLHMMGRDDIPVGLGSLNALGTPNLGCRYVEAIPHGSGGFIDSDTLYGLARNLPRSPRRFTADNSIKYGAPRNTSHPELRQPSALEVWNSISRKRDPSQKMTLLTNGPLTNIASILLSDKNASSTIQNLYVVGGHIAHREKGNLFTVQSNKYAEFNMYLDPLAAKTVLESDVDITLIPLQAQRQVTSFPRILRSLQFDGKTAELKFSQTLLSLLHKLQQQHQTYQHMDIFLGEILGAVFMANQGYLDPIIQKIKISAMVGNKNTDGQLIIDETNGRVINILDSLNSEAYYYQYAKLLNEMSQSAVVGSFDQQKKKWCAAPEKTK